MQKEKNTDGKNKNHFVIVNIITNVKMLKSDDLIEATKTTMNKIRIYGTSSLCQYVSNTHADTCNAI